MRAWTKLALYTRSALFYPVLYINWALFLVFGSWLLLGPRRWAMAGLAAHGRVTVWLLRVVCSTKMEVRGHEKLLAGPSSSPRNIRRPGTRSRSSPLMRDPALVMKAELLSIPLYGTFCRKFELIPVQRELGPAALRQMAREARMRAAEGREILIFPEGTRKIPGSPPDYKPGIAFPLSGPQNPGLPAGAQLRRLLATPFLPAIPRNDCRRIPGPHPAGPATPGVYAKAGSRQSKRLRGSCSRKPGRTLREWDLTRLFPWKRRTPS